MLKNITKKKTYLVYQVGSCEMESNGWSSRYFPCVAQGNTKEEVINNWVENVKTLYGVIMEPKYDAKSDSYYDYYGIYIRNIYPRFNNCRSHKYVILTINKVHHPLLKIGRLHLSMPYNHLRIRT